MTDKTYPPTRGELLAWVREVCAPTPLDATNFAYRLFTLLKEGRALLARCPEGR